MKILSKILLTIIVVVSFSCSNIVELANGVNKESKSKEYYLKLFERKGIDANVIYFPVINDQKERNQFLYQITRQKYYYFYGVIKNENSKYWFKNIPDASHGCQQVLFLLQNETIYPLKCVQKDEIPLLNYSYKNSIGVDFVVSNKKTVILLYNHAIGKAIFKDIKPVLEFVQKNNEYNFRIIVADFLNE